MKKRQTLSDKLRLAFHFIASLIQIRAYSRIYVNSHKNESDTAADNRPLHGHHICQRAKDKNDPFRLMGFGHRVYKAYDPRAEIVRNECDKYLKHSGINDPLLDLAHRIEEIALSDEYFIERNLYPNVDFYTGILYRAMGIPENMFTVMFALARLPGWVAHWREMIGHSTKLVRPRQIYTGNAGREVAEDMAANNTLII